MIRFKTSEPRSSSRAFKWWHQTDCADEQIVGFEQTVAIAINSR
jgi:hypothetical protein